MLVKMLGMLMTNEPLQSCSHQATSTTGNDCRRNYG
jgi:hypothetical protein